MKGTKKDAGAILHKEWREAFESMDDASRGRLVLGMMDFMDGKEPSLEGVEKVVFSLIRGRLAADKEAYDTNATQRSEAGKKGAVARWSDGGATKPDEKPMAKNGKRIICHTESEKTDGKNGEIEIEIEKEIETANAVEREKEREAPTLPPTVEEVAEYCRENGFTSIDPQHFVEYNNARGWTIGGAQVMDWRAVVRSWVARDKKRQNTPAPKTATYQNRFHNFEERKIDYDAILRQELAREALA